MGAGASTAPTEADFPVPQDLATAKEQVEKLRALLEEQQTESVVRFFHVMLEKRLPSDEEGTLDDWQEMRTELLDGLALYRKLATPSEPTSAAELIERSGDSVNLSTVERDEDGVPGHLYVFGLPALTELPDQVLNGSVKWLSLKKNGLTDIPTQIRDMENLEFLDVSENTLTELPDSFTELKRLETLNLSENNLNILPETLGDMENLKELIVFKNQLTKLPESIGNCKQLEEINFFNNKLIKIPKSLCDLASLRDLNLGGNKLKTIPSTRNWVNIERLALSWNTIMMLNDFGGMPKLKQLQLNRNQLETLDDECFSECKELTVADLSSNRFAKLPDSISQATTLQTLNCSSNELKALPSLSAMSGLEILNAGSNKIESLDSAEVGDAQSLMTLLLNDNALESLPEVLSTLPKLARVNVSKNAKLEIPDDLRTALRDCCETNKGRWIE